MQKEIENHLVAQDNKSKQNVESLKTMMDIYFNGLKEKGETGSKRMLEKMETFKEDL
jgi:hypothetical protein